MTDRRQHPSRRGADRAAESHVRWDGRAEGLQRIALGLLTILTVVSVAAAVALTVALFREEASRQAADRAARLATASARAAAATYSRVSAEADGLCSALNQSRAYIDDAHLVLHDTFAQTAALEYRQAAEFRHGISRGVREAGLRAGTLGKRFAQTARHIRYLRTLDCKALTANPRRYRLPTVRSFGSRGAPR